MADRNFAPVNQHMAGETPAAMFPDHQALKQRVTEKLSDKHSKTVTKPSEVTTASVREGTEELLEVLSTPQGRLFVRIMAQSVIQGYLEVAETKGARDTAIATSRDAADGVIQSVKVELQNLFRIFMRTNQASLKDVAGSARKWMSVVGLCMVLSLLRFIIFGTAPLTCASSRS